jgi:hypothetical protein
MPRCNVSSVIAAKPKPAENFNIAAVLFIYILQNHINKTCIVFTVPCSTYIQDHKIIAASFAATSKCCASAILLFLIAGDQKAQRWDGN